MSLLTVVGIGPGSPGYFMPIAKEKMKKAHTVIAARRLLPMLQEYCPSETTCFEAMGKIKDTIALIDQRLKEEKDVVLTVSGDPLMYSLYKTILNDPVSVDWEIEVIPGIGSL